MAFPLDPTNGEQTTQNGIVYIYNATLGVWAVLTNTAGNISAGNIVVTNSVASDTVTAAGNISGNYFIGNGSQLTGLPESYSNANVAAYLPTYTGNLVSLTGNITTTANVSGNFFIGNGSQLTGLPESYGNANVAAYLPTYTGNLAALTGNITTTANVSGNFFIGNGSQLTGITASGGTADSGVFLNAQTITANVDISNVYNAFSVGPLTQAANVVVTQAAGSRWVIL
jgi:hypothetical protein